MNYGNQIGEIANGDSPPIYFYPHKSYYNRTKFANNQPLFIHNSPQSHALSTNCLELLVRWPWLGHLARPMEARGFVYEPHDWLRRIQNKNNPNAHRLLDETRRGRRTENTSGSPQKVLLSRFVCTVYGV